MKILSGLCGLIALFAAPLAGAACVDNVVLVHGNARYTSDFNNTYNELISRGYTAAQIYRPSWGSKSCPACNDHNGSEETPVRNAINSAIAASCTGKIDVIGHSMGVTLAAKQIIDLNKASKVHTFIGIAAGYRGLWSCGAAYPFQYATTTCGYWGLSVNSPFLNSIYGVTLGTDVYSFYSWQDEIVCATGVCTVGGVHSSRIAGADADYLFAAGHYGLLYYTDDTQADLIQ
ncbi:MAG: lipase [Nevskiales bacterium]